MRLLLESGREGLSPSELAEKMNLKIPTVMSHLETLEKIGVVRFELRKMPRGRPLKKYRVIDSVLTIDIDLEALVKIPSWDELDNKMYEYISRKKETSRLPLRFSVEDIAETMNFSLKEAIILLDYLNMKTDQIVGFLVSEALEKFKGREIFEIEEISNELNIHEYWAAKVASRLASTGMFELKEGKLKRVKL